MSIIGSLPYSLANGTTADATQVMADFNAIVNGVNNASTGAAPIPSVQSSAYNYAADTGTVNNIIVAVSPSPGSYTDGLSVTTKAANTNTSSTMTVKFGSLGTKSLVVDAAGTLPAIGSYIAGMHYRLEYDSTQDKVILMNPSTATGSATVTVTGHASDPTGTINYELAPNGAVFVNIPADISGASNSTSCTVTGIPSALSPVTTKTVQIILIDAGTRTFSNLSTGTGTTWTLRLGATTTAASFTGAGTKGLVINQFSFTKS
jgi:hypothetical protein